MYYDIAESGKRIKQQRKASGMSQEEFGKVLGISQQCVANMESGRHGSRIDTMVLMANRFNTSLDYLILGKIHNEINITIPSAKKEIAIKIFKAIIENI